MKISVSTKNLVDGLRKVINVVGPRSTLPVLNNVLLTSKEERLALSTTDLEVSITTSIEATVEEEGETTIPAKKFNQIVSSLHDGLVNIETDPTMTTRVTSGNASFKIMGLDPSEFPQQTRPEGEHPIVLNKLEFSKTLRKIGYSASTDQTRLVLNGILLSIKDNSLTAVATDGRRLALVEKNLDTPPALIETEVILPTKAVNELQKLLDSEGEVSINISNSSATFEIQDTVITTKLIDGEYPDYRQVIPGSFQNSVVLPRETVF